ncbi:MAG: hypothetical protein NVS3B26_30510 [Mycobacteriales bacterium]
MTLTAARQVADAVLYEGYLLYPYRASSSKNMVRWQFGVLGPVGASAAGVGELPWMSAEVLLDSARGATVDVVLRFLQVQARTVQRWTGTTWEDTAELTVGDTRWIPFHEAAPREIPLLGLALEPQRLVVSVPGGEEIEELNDGSRLVGRLVRTRWPVRGHVSITTRAGKEQRITVLGVAVHNDTGWTAGAIEAWSERDVAARHSFVGTHLLLTAAGARFLSLLEGPDWSDLDAKSCAQVRCWPVLIADDDGADAVLVAPIILGDRPSIAPESAGDLFDATEIDEILTLRIMTMTEAEKAEARGTDPRAAAILDRCDGMSARSLELLHGARRDWGVPRYADGELAGVELPWWDAAEDARAEPEQDAVMVAGVPVAMGSRVRLRPSRRADAQDIFLAGMSAVVTRVYFDVDGNTHVAVALEGDPGADLYGATGRFYYFSPEEIEPLPVREDAR